MTELVQTAGVALRDWLERHLGAALAVVFASGVAWAQFGAVESALAETRSELRELRREFVAFRLSGEAVARVDFAAQLAWQRDIDQRQDAAIDAMRDRLIGGRRAAGSAAPQP